ncbi:MAG: hypothetical protein V3T84_04330 [Phycisphaerales bacterium]
MELLASSNHGGPTTCLETNVNVRRRCGQAIVLVTVSIVALVATGCASLEAPQSAIGLADLERPLNSAPPTEFGVDVLAELLVEPVAVLEGNDLVAHWFSGGDPLQAPSMRDTLFERRWPLAASEEALAASDDWDWTRLWVPSHADLLTPLSVALDTDSSAADSPWWASAPDVQLARAAVLPRADSQVVAIDEPPSLTPRGALVLPVITSTTMTFPVEVWPGVMKATAAGFLAAILLVPFGCSFAAGAVRGQPRASPRAKRAPSRFLADLSRAIANVPAH